MQLPEPFVQIFIQFQPLLTQPSYQKMLSLAGGRHATRARQAHCYLCPENSRVGLADQPNWSKYHNLLNRNRWSALAANALLLGLLIKTFLALPLPLRS